MTKSYEIWGLTGGIASGKSTAARIFEEAGVPVIDADLIARELSAPGGAAHEAIVSHFGTGDRALLRGIVFEDPAQRKALEKILHPLIEAESLRRMELLAREARGHGTGSSPYRILYEAALLVETGRYKKLAGLIVVDAPAHVRRQRLIERDGVAPMLADSILSAQISDEERRKVATAVISNAGTINELRDSVLAWMKQMGWRD